MKSFTKEIIKTKSKNTTKKKQGYQTEEKNARETTTKKPDVREKKSNKQAQQTKIQSSIKEIIQTNPQEDDQNTNLPRQQQN